MAKMAAPAGRALDAGFNLALTEHGHIEWLLRIFFAYLFHQDSETIYLILIKIVLENALTLGMGLPHEIEPIFSLFQIGRIKKSIENML